MNRNFTYINIDREENKVFSYGVKFSEFIEFVRYKPTNILLLRGQFWGGEWNDKLMLEYVNESNMDDLIVDDIYSYGDFKWVDFKGLEKLNSLSEEEKAELLYAAHFSKPLKNPFFKKLDNEYLYLSHDDEFSVVVYMRNLKDYKEVLKGLILKNMKGRRKAMSDIPEEIIQGIYESAMEGIAFDFDGIQRREGGVTLRVYRLGKFESGDDAHDVFDRRENVFKTYTTLEYNRGKWKEF